MKEFIKKNRRNVILGSICLLLILAISYMYISRSKKTILFNSDGNKTKQEVAYSKEIGEIYDYAQEWSDDVKLFRCSTGPFSVEQSDLDNYTWTCTFYSDAKKQTKLFTYSNGQLKKESEPAEVIECVEHIYKETNTATSTDDVAALSSLYSKALEEGLDTQNSVIYHLQYISDYGFVWILMERGKPVQKTSTPAPLLNSYIFDTFTGELVDITTKEIPLF